MSNRTAKFVSAIFASVLAGSSLATISHSAAAECLSGPKEQTPEGSHWYFRIEHPSERHCWYLRKAGEKISQLASPDSAPAAKPASPKPEPAIQRSIADAHAEVLQDKSATTVPPVPAMAGTENTALANPGVANPQASTIASRWPGQPDAGSPISQQPLGASPVASAPANSTIAAPRAVTAVSLATADSLSKGQFGSIQMWLTIAMGAMSLAAVMGGALFRFGGTRWTGEREESRGHRGVDWGPHPVRSAYQNIQMPEGTMPRDPRAADDPDRRIAEMLARLSRSAAA